MRNFKRMITCFLLSILFTVSFSTAVKCFKYTSDMIEFILEHRKPHKRMKYGECDDLLKKFQEKFEGTEAAKTATKKSLYQLFYYHNCKKTKETLSKISHKYNTYSGPNEIPCKIYLDIYRCTFGKENPESKDLVLNTKRKCLVLDTKKTCLSNFNLGEDEYNPVFLGNYVQENTFFDDYEYNPFLDDEPCFFLENKIIH